jgi:hypothetical protein
MPELHATCHGTETKTLEDGIDNAKRMARSELRTQEGFFSEDWFKAQREAESERIDSDEFAATQH